MNRRQTEKHFKRKWREVIAKCITDSTGVRVKPSRLKLRVITEGKNYHFVGSFSGYTIDLKGELKE